MHWYQICFGFLLLWMLIFHFKNCVYVFQMVFNIIVVQECGRNNVIFRETSFFSFPTVKGNEIELLKKRRSIWIHLENHVYSLNNVNTIFEMKITIHKNKKESFSFIKRERVFRGEDTLFRRLIFRLLLSFSP